MFLNLQSELDESLTDFMNECNITTRDFKNECDVTTSLSLSYLRCIQHTTYHTDGKEIDIQVLMLKSGLGMAFCVWYMALRGLKVQTAGSKEGKNMYIALLWNCFK